MRPQWLMRSIIFSVALVLLVLISSMYELPALAQQPVPTPSDDQVNAVAKQMYCPVCENIPLDVCGTQACTQWRALIREKLGQGWTNDQIKSYFAEQYGDRVLATPPIKNGLSLNLLVYIVPPLVILGGVFILVRALRSWKISVKTDTSISPQNEPTSSNDKYIHRVEEELRRRE